MGGVPKMSSNKTSGSEFQASQPRAQKNTMYSDYIAHRDFQMSNFDNSGPPSHILAPHIPKRAFGML